MREQNPRLAMADQIASLGALGAWRARLERTLQVKFAPITREHVASTPLFNLPADAEIMLITIFGQAGADAVGSAEVVVGRQGGSAQFFVRPRSVLGPLGEGQIVPSDVRLGMVPEALTVTGRYDETGVPSTTGGPWYVGFFYTRDP